MFLLVNAIPVWALKLHSSFSVHAGCAALAFKIKKMNTNPPSTPQTTIDYWCDDGLFQFPQVHWQSPTPLGFLIVKQVSILVDMKAWGSSAWFRNLQVPTTVYKCYLQMHLLAKRFVFFSGDDGSWKRKSRSIYWHQYCLLTRHIFLHKRLYSLFLPQGS
jgi:hypothetical protein